MTSRRVLFVSKPVVPPWHDGSKNLVRDVASALPRHHATVMTSLGHDPPERTSGWPIYAGSGGFAPALTTNARVLSALVRARGFDIWHFVFAPNVASSSAARVAISAGRMRDLRGVVQTIASRPKTFRGSANLLFGDAVVALSEWTRARLLASRVNGKRLHVIPPCARPPRTVSQAEREQLRSELSLGRSPVVVYPGDLEVSTGAETTAASVRTLVQRIPEARVVFACRKKTATAADREGALRASLERQKLGHAVRFVGELPDLAALYTEASVVVLPADDLYGKVDVPLAVIEALALGVPLVLARGGPLESVTSASFVEPGDAEGVAAACVELIASDDARRSHGDAGRALYRARFSPEVVAAQYADLYDRLDSSRSTS